MDKADVVSGVTDTLYDYCTFTDEARLDDFVMLFCEDGCFDAGRALIGRERSASSPPTC